MVCEDVFNCVELFAGAGGLLLGLETAGFRTLLANEVHPHPCMTLRDNFKHVPIVQHSIQELTGPQLLQAAGYDPKCPPRIDVVAGGPPCQGFSTAGLKDAADPRNSLIGDYIRIVGDLQPRFFILENVPGLTTLHKGRLFENMMNELADLSYDLRFQILNVADYGVPQMRKRLIILGAREGRAPLHPEPAYRSPESRDLFSIGKPAYITCGEAIGDLPMINTGEIATEYDSPPTTEYQRLMREGSTRLHNHQASRHREDTMEYYSLVPLGGTWLDIPRHLRKRKQGIQRWPLDGISRAITTEPTDFLHPTLNRVPTVRETARIQSFPDRYVFLGQRTTGNRMRRLGYCSQTQQVGNAVPPRLAELVGREINKCCQL